MSLESKMQGLTPPKPSLLDAETKLCNLAVQLDLEKANAAQDMYNIKALLEFQRLFVNKSYYPESF